MWSRLSSGPRSIQPPDGQKMPTFDDMNELTMSGTLPERSAAKIFVSTMPPTTFTLTSGCFWSYSATTFLNSVSSWPALQPTQAVIVVACRCLVDAEPTDTATAPAAISASRAIPVATRFIPVSSSVRGGKPVS